MGWFFQAVGNCWMLKLGLCVFVSLEVAEKLWLQWLLLNLGKHEGLWVFVHVSGVNCQNWGPMCLLCGAGGASLGCGHLLGHPCLPCSALEAAQPGQSRALG